MWADACQALGEVGNTSYIGYERVWDFHNDSLVSQLTDEAYNMSSGSLEYNAMQKLISILSGDRKIAKILITHACCIDLLL